MKSKETFIDLRLGPSGIGGMKYKNSYSIIIDFNKVFAATTFECVSKEVCLQIVLMT